MFLGRGPGVGRGRRGEESFFHMYGVCIDQFCAVCTWVPIKHAHGGCSPRAKPEKRRTLGQKVRAAALVRVERQQRPAQLGCRFGRACRGLGSPMPRSEPIASSQGCSQAESVPRQSSVAVCGHGRF